MNTLNELTFTFYEKKFSIYYTDNNRFYLPLNKLCEAIGINHDSQRKRIQSSPVINVQSAISFVQKLENLIDKKLVLHIIDFDREQSKCEVKDKRLF